MVEAFLVGNRLCRFLSSVLPTHPDYWSTEPEIAKNRTKSHSQLMELMYFVKQLAVMIDEEEHQSYISRVLDSSSCGTTSAATTSKSVYQNQKSNKHVAFSNAASQGGHHHHNAMEATGSTSVETDSSSESAPDPSLEDMPDDSVATEDNHFDTMWAQVATTTNTHDVDKNISSLTSVTTTGSVRTRPMKDPRAESPNVAVEDNEEDPQMADWHSFSEDTSWSRFSLSVSSSKFAEEQRRAAVDHFVQPPPPQVVKSKRKKKRSKAPLEPIRDEEDEAETTGRMKEMIFPETQLERRLRRAQRNLQQVSSTGMSATDDDDDYPPPPESDYVHRNQPHRPPREPRSSPTSSILPEWPPGWETLPTWDDDNNEPNKNTRRNSNRLDDTEVSLMTDRGHVSACQRLLTRRQRALRGLKCVKCLI